MTVKLVLLKSGEDVVADVAEMCVGEAKAVVGYFLKQPCRVRLFATEENESSIKISPWVPLSKDDTIPVPTDWVVSIVDPIDQVLTLYQNSLKKYGKPEGPGAEQPESTDAD